MTNFDCDLFAVRVVRVRALKGGEGSLPLSDTSSGRMVRPSSVYIGLFSFSQGGKYLVFDTVL